MLSTIEGATTRDNSYASNVVALSCVSVNRLRKTQVLTLRTTGMEALGDSRRILKYTPFETSMPWLPVKAFAAARTACATAPRREPAR